MWLHVKQMVIAREIELYVVPISPTIISNISLSKTSQIRFYWRKSLVTGRLCTPLCTMLTCQMKWHVSFHFSCYCWALSGGKRIPSFHYPCIWYWVSDPSIWLLWFWPRRSGHQRCHLLLLDSAPLSSPHHSLLSLNSNSNNSYNSVVS